MTALAEPDRVHELRVINLGGHRHKVQIDGHEIQPTHMRIEFDQAAEYAIATLQLPVITENIQALAVLDISLDTDGADPLEEC